MSDNKALERCLASMYRAGTYQPLVDELTRIVAMPCFTSGRDPHEAAVVDGQRQLARRLLNMMTQQ